MTPHAPSNCAKAAPTWPVNALTFDTVVALEQQAELCVVQRAPGTVLSYMAFNPARSDTQRSSACARPWPMPSIAGPILEYLGRGFARPADSVLPPESWAYNGNVPHYEHDPERPAQLLDQAGYPLVNGVRFHITMKTSTEESTRLLAAVLQQQLREVGIALDIRTFEFATFFSDVTHGAFQFYSLRWIGGNEDPDIFEYVFDSAKFPPNGANRGYYSNPQVDRLIDQAGRTRPEHAQAVVCANAADSRRGSALHQPVVLRQCRGAHAGESAESH